MNANYIYDIFETAKQNGVDLTIGLEILRGTQPIPEGVTKAELNAFIGLHEDLLGRAYRTGNRKLFADIVQVCVESNEDEEDLLRRARATGNELLIAEVEACYGGGGHV